jgi:AraC family transcriptional regulator
MRPSTSSVRPCVTDLIHSTDAISAKLITYARGLTLPTHAHDSAGFAYTFSGEYVERYDRIAFTCRRGVVTYSPPFAPHSNTFADAPCRCLIIELKPRWMTKLELQQKLTATPDYFCGETFAALSRRFVHELSQDDAATPIALQALTLELIALALRGDERRHRRPPRWLVQVKERLDVEFASNLSLAELAAAAGIHPVHLAAQFRAHYGCTVGGYVRRRRIDLACQRIRAGKRSLLDIALEAGFATQSHFSRVFRVEVGVTPTEFRASLCRREP